MSNDELNENLIEAVMSGCLSKVRLSLSRGADANAKDKDGTPVLILALKNEYSKIANILLSRSADANAKDKDGTPVLIWAVKHGDLEIIKSLLFMHDADVNAQDKDGNTALIVATKDGKSEIVEFLAIGAVLNIGDNDGYTALMWAVKNGDLEISKILIERDADIRMGGSFKPLAIAEEYGRWEIAKYMVEYIIETLGIDANATNRSEWSEKNSEGDTEFIFAAKHGAWNVAKRIVDRALKRR